MINMFPAFLKKKEEEAAAAATVLSVGEARARPVLFTCLK
jgi:hypothetical protein